MILDRYPQPYPMTVYYESTCPLCQAEMTNLMLRNQNDQLKFVDISAPGFKDFPPGATMQDLMTLIHAQLADGSVIKGVDVFRLAYSAAGLDWVSSLASLPIVGTLADKAYPVLARNRHRLPRVLIRLLFETGIRRAAQRRQRAHIAPPRLVNLKVIPPSHPQESCHEHPRAQYPRAAADNCTSDIVPATLCVAYPQHAFCHRLPDSGRRAKRLNFAADFFG